MSCLASLIPLSFTVDVSVFHTLLEESDEKSFPENDLLRQLRLFTQDAEKCSSVAQQLLNGKRQTRYRYTRIQGYESHTKHT